MNAVIIGLGNGILILGLSLVSAHFESRGVFHGSQWADKGVLNWLLALRALLYFTLSGVFYLAVVPFLDKVGVRVAEIQFAIWFAVSVIGLAVATGNFRKWDHLGQAVAVLVFLGICFLAIRYEDSDSGEQNQAEIAQTQTSAVNGGSV